MSQLTLVGVGYKPKLFSQLNLCFQSLLTKIYNLICIGYVFMKLAYLCFCVQIVENCKVLQVCVCVFLFSIFQTDLYMYRFNVFTGHDCHVSLQKFYFPTINFCLEQFSVTGNSS